MSWRPTSALGTRLGVEHLTAKGHRRIGLLVVESSLSVGERRREGWKQALEAAGVEADETLVAAGRLDAESGLEAMRRLLELPEPPTAVFADNLVLVTGALRALAERGLRCPQDLEIVSSDDAEWLDVFAPPVTTIVQPAYQLGAEAAQLLLERIEQPGRAPRTVILKPTLRPRPTAGKPAETGGKRPGTAEKRRQSTPRRAVLGHSAARAPLGVTCFRSGSYPHFECHKMSQISKISPPARPRGRPRRSPHSTSGIQTGLGRTGRERPTT